MFAMYDDDGLNFRSTIDNLYTVHEIAPSKRIKNDTKEKSDNKFESFYKGKINQEAKDKYKQMANLDTKVEVFHVEQIMSRTAIIISDTKTITECFDLMQENEVQQLLIQADNFNHLKGMITKHDILNYLMDNNENKNIYNTHISEITKNKIITTDPISDIRRVAKVMIDFNLNAIPVVDGEENILGVVTRHDIVDAVSNIPHLQIWA
jgi:CBS domain-containing protein